jgi:gamma-glutamylcyclotransferase
MMREVLVFAYGSNLDDDQMRARCPSAQVEAKAILTNHALAFGGFSHRWGGAVASVVAERGTDVAGLVYRISAADLLALDGYEGSPFAYERVVKVVTTEHGRRRRAQLYRQPADTFEPWLPQRAYFDVLLRAYDRLGFDAAQLAAAVEAAR